MYAMNFSFFPQNRATDANLVGTPSNRTSSVLPDLLSQASPATPPRHDKSSSEEVIINWCDRFCGCVIALNQEFKSREWIASEHVNADFPQHNFTFESVVILFRSNQRKMYNSKQSRLLRYSREEPGLNNCVKAYKMLILRLRSNPKIVIDKRIF